MPSKRRGKGRHRGHGAQEVHDLLKGLDNVRFIPYMRPLAAAVGWQLPAEGLASPVPLAIQTTPEPPFAC